MSEAARVGMIGLGLVGTALSQRLLERGWEVLGYDIDAARVEAFKQAGGIAAESAEHVARESAHILLSLPTSDIVEQVVGQIAGELQPGAIILDTTTGVPDSSVATATKLHAIRASYIDATLIGSSKQIRAGEGVLLSGGCADAASACEDLIAVIAGKHFHVGPSGSAAQMKLVVNLVLGLNRAVLAEGLVYAERAGVDPQLALEVLRAGASYSRVMDSKGPKMLAGEFEPEARLWQHLKDVRLILASAERAGAQVPLSLVHAQLLEAAERLGYGDRDNSAVITAYRAASGGPTAAASPADPRTGKLS